jgi:hypothetical protein
MSRGSGSELAARLARICNDDEQRREMLWLRAMEKGDEPTARDLERIDPGLRERVADVRRSAEAVDPRSAAELYGRAYDERLE